jgi:hypothetical protein
MFGVGPCKAISASNDQITVDDRGKMPRLTTLSKRLMKFRVFVGSKGK